MGPPKDLPINERMREYNWRKKGGRTPSLCPPTLLQILPELGDHQFYKSCSLHEINLSDAT